MSGFCDAKTSPDILAGMFPLTLVHAVRGGNTLTLPLSPQYVVFKTQILQNHTLTSSFSEDLGQLGVYNTKFNK